MIYKPSFCFCPAGIDACALWRMYMPHLNIEHSRFIFSQGFPPLDEIAECDILVVQRMMTEANFEFIKIVRNHGLKIVYDLDDNIWNLPKENPAHYIFSKRDFQEGAESCMLAADAITVSTDHLLHVVKQKLQFKKNPFTDQFISIRKIENRADRNLLTLPVVEKDEDKVVIGWAGSNTHDGDLKVLWKVLPEILELHKNVFIEFAGSGPSFNSPLWKHPRVKIRPWCHVVEYANRFATWNWDIVLAPLANHSFNLSKSGIKMIEAGTIQKPCLASNIAPYAKFANKRKALKWLLCESYSWQHKIQTLIKDKSRRLALGQEMYSNVLEHYSIESSVSEWQTLGLSLMS